MTAGGWDAELTRRRLLQLGVATAAAGGLGPLTRAGARAVPARVAGADPRRFASAEQLRAWHRELDRLGLRATGTPVHERYIDTLHERLERAGVRRLHLEAVPFRRWTTETWRLEIAGGPAAGPVRTAAYIPYSGHTSHAGVSGPLAVVDPGSTPPAGSLAGKVAIFDVPLTSLPYSYFASLSYELYDPRGVFAAPGAVYARPWLGIGAVIELLDGLARAGATAAVGVLDLPADAAHGAYYPYDGVIRDVPGVYVDRTVGARLKALAATGASATVTVPSRIVRTTSRNLLGVIPGASRELMILHSHTDGTNGIEDNGPDAIVAASRYLAALPRRRLPRTVLVLLTTGHFIGARGTESFVARHRHDLLARTAASVTIEHLGAREWAPGADGRSRLTGRAEPGTFFAPETSALVAASFAALKRAKAAPSSVLRPYVPAPGSRSPDGHGWPAEGTPLWTAGALPTTNYITGPTYLLNWGIATVDMFDAHRARREAIAFTELLLRLGRIPRGRLRRLDLLTS